MSRRFTFAYLCRGMKEEVGRVWFCSGVVGVVVQEEVVVDGRRKVRRRDGEGTGMRDMV